MRAWWLTTAGRCTLTIQTQCAQENHMLRIFWRNSGSWLPLIIISMPQCVPDWKYWNSCLIGACLIKTVNVHCKLILLIIQNYLADVTEKILKADLKSAWKNSLEKCFVVSDDCKKKRKEIKLLTCVVLRHVFANYCILCSIVLVKSKWQRVWNSSCRYIFPCLVVY